MTSTVCVLQARTGSNRLPGKVLADVAGRPMLRFMLDRLASLDVDRLVVATSVLERDDPIAAIAADAGAACVRGPETDVLARFLLVLEQYPASTVVRLTADCPLVDPALVTAVVDRHRDQAADFTSNVLPRTFPRGLDVEVTTADALRTAAAEAAAGPEREHVMPFLYRHPERFRLANLGSGADLGEERWTVDTQADLDNVRRIAALLPPEAGTGWRDTLAAAGRTVVIEPGILRLRPATAADSGDILAWRNQPDAVKLSRSGRAIEPGEHQGWFGARLDDPGCRLWMAERDGVAVASMRVDVRDSTGEVSLAVAPHERGKGVGAAMLGLLQAQVRSEVQVDVLTAWVHDENPASRRAFAKTGFAEAGRDGLFQMLRWARMDPGQEVRG